MRTLSLFIVAVAVLVAQLHVTSAADAPANAGLAIGWRGDGTGHFPAADPPLEWARRSSSLLWGMRDAGDVPADNADGDLVPPTLGWLTHWQVLGPIAVADGAKALAAPTVADEADLRPSAVPGKSDAKWRPLTAGPDLYLDQALGKGENRAAYLHTAVFTKAGGKVGLWVGANTHAVRVWLNGAVVFTRDHPADGNARVRTMITLRPGWNRLLYKLTQAERGWNLSTWLSAAQPVTYATENLAWAARLPGPSMGSPIVVGDAVYCVSEPNDLACIDKGTGKVRWVRRTSLYDAATPDEQRAVGAEATPILARLAEIDQAMIERANGDQPFDPKVRAEKEKLNKQLAERMVKLDEKRFRVPQKQDHGYTTPTPCSDGERVFVSFTTGIAAAYDLAGNRLWANFENRGNNEHGNHYSPVLAGDRLILCMNTFIRALGKRTGQQLWQTKNRHATCNSPVVTKIDGQDVVVTGTGSLLRAADGKAFGALNPLGSSGCPSPIVHDGIMYGLSSGGGGGVGLSAFELPKTTDAKDTRELWRTPLGDHDLEAEFKVPITFAGGFVASPLYHDGLIYLVSEGGILIVLDARTGQRVYGRLLDLHPRVAYITAPGVAASPIFAGGRIHVFDNSGESITFAPGRAYRQLAKNTIENILGPNEWNEAQEQLMSTPWFDGRSIYVRSPEFLYCVRAR